MSRYAFGGLWVLVTLVVACQRPQTADDAASGSSSGSGVSLDSPANGSAPAPVLDDAELEALTRTLAGLRIVGRERPEQLDAAIAASGLSTEQIDSALFRIAADPEASALYVELSDE